MCTSRTSKPARLRFKPPGPRALRRRSCVSIDSGIGLVDHLRQLAAAEEILDRRRDALGIDQRARGHFLDVLQAHPLLHGAAELEKALADFVGRQFVDRPQPAIAQVVDVVDVGRRIVRCAAGRGSGWR